MSENKTIRVGTRKSKLAMVQTEHVISLLQAKFPEKKFEIVSMSTTGDNILNVALNKIGEKSLFTKELEMALEEKTVDFVVHSLKDLPTVLPKNMVIGAVLEREDPRDALVLKNGSKFSKISDLPPGSVIGTSSVRRRAQLMAKFPELKFADIRGNLNTRFKKLDDGDDYSAIILAAAGVKRMDWSQRISQLLDVDCCIHAVGQGAIAIECLQDDEETLDLLWNLNHLETMICCIAERAVMRTLEGGCSAPVASHAEIVNGNGNGNLSILAGVWSLDGKDQRVTTKTIQLDGKVERNIDRKPYSSVLAPTAVKPEILLQMCAAESAGKALADQLLAEGAGEILAAARLDNQTPVLNFGK